MIADNCQLHYNRTITLRETRAKIEKEQGN